MGVADRETGGRAGAAFVARRRLGAPAAAREGRGGQGKMFPAAAVFGRPLAQGKRLLEPGSAWATGPGGRPRSTAGPFHALRVWRGRFQEILQRKKWRGEVNLESCEGLPAAARRSRSTAACAWVRGPETAGHSASPTRASSGEAAAF